MLPFSRDLVGQVGVELRAQRTPPRFGQSAAGEFVLDHGFDVRHAEGPFGLPFIAKGACKRP
jgi:hypothetical protein